MEPTKRPPGKAFVVVLGLTALITPLAVHLFFPVIPAVKAALGLTDAHAQLTFSISLFGMAFATLFYGSLSDRYGRRPVDRKSTRLNSSHSQISYAVFCLKKKNITINPLLAYFKLPPDFRAIPDAASLTRVDLPSLIAISLPPLLEHPPAHPVFIIIARPQ